MSNDLSDLDGWVTDLIETLEPTSRRQLLGRLSRILKTGTQRRMISQTDARGRRWAGRKDGSRRKMFKRLRLSRNLKSRATADHLSVGWSGRTGRIARVHHYGLRDRVSKRGVRVKYESRELLGLSRQDRQQINDHIGDWLVES